MALQERQRPPRRNNAAPNGDFAKIRPHGSKSAQSWDDFARIAIRPFGQRGYLNV
jgi:hypothetical protein